MFTPLVSPAVTPLDTHFTNLPDYSMSGAGYFSPLTSPALEAQHHGYYPYTLSTENTSKASSPVDLSDSPVMNKKAPANAGRRKSVAGSRNPARVVRESPSMKPIRKKTQSALSQAPELAQSLVQQAQILTSRQQSLNNSAMNELSMSANGREGSAESISPEPMPESLMAPPPTPGSRGGTGTNESAMQPNQAKTGTSISWQMGPPSNVKPATPASLMKLPKSGIPADAMQMPSAEASLKMLDRGQLGGHAYSNSIGPSREDSPVSDEQPTPTMNASSQRTPRGTPLLISTNPSLSSAKSSKTHSPVAIQPLLAKPPASSLNTPRLTPKLQPMNSSSRSKRSVPASPALIPKISPHIKPLLSNSTLMADRSTSIQNAASIILASKSNYQNIVEGNSSSLGLCYPEDLSTGLTSKRTSHKIAEQGRRNRINTALQEMATLLPPTTPNPGEKSDADIEASKSSASQATSKAVTVERAIEYIRLLQLELEETKSKLQVAEGKLSNTDDSEGKADDGSAADVLEEADSSRTEDQQPHSNPNGEEVVMSG
ncbi:hypothetical protein DFH27DRAFT_234798 [Peziza echinospora]|nr:hypothetical protein DFH27DRAFT_234798 [Peziza echinospora]